MAETLDMTEADIPIFHKARKKFDKCSNAEISPHFLGYCKLFHYTYDKSMDFLVYCGGCRANREEPSINFPARKS